MKTVILFSGYNMRAVYAFIRTLEKQTIPYSIIASSDDDEIFQTAYKKHVSVIRHHKHLEVEDIVASIKAVQKKSDSKSYLIAPSTEALNRLLLEYKSVFDNLNCTIPLVDKKIYEEVSDKYSFGKLCLKYNILIPKEYSALNIQVPCVAKPKTYVSRYSKKIFKPILITNNNQLEDFMNNHHIDDFYYQEFLEGRSLYLLYYFYKDGMFMKFSQENFIQQSHGRSILAAKSAAYHMSEHSIPYENLFQTIGYTGLVMIEVKETKNSVYMIEANPRFWGPSQLFVDAEINFFEALLYDYGLLLTRPENNLVSNNVTSYFWDDGVSYLEKNIDFTAFHNYSKQQFLNEYDQWKNSNILNREDTLNIHQKLIQGVISEKCE